VPRSTGRRLGALFDPLHDGVECSREFGRALSRVGALIRERLHQVASAACPLPASFSGLPAMRTEPQRGSMRPQMLHRYRNGNSPRRQSG
jgi:hypothetical protein